REPCIALIQDHQEDVYVFGFDSHGRVFSEPFRADNLNSLIVYDQGYGGYAAQVQLPFMAYANGREDREAANLHHLALQLRHSLKQIKTFSPPLRMLYESCQLSNADFIEQTLDFLKLWDQSQGWLIPLDYPLPNSLVEILEKIDWDESDLQTKN